MKIVYVAMEYAYGRRELGIDYLSLDGFQKSLEKLGHNVVPFYYDDYLDNIPSLQGDLRNFADKHRPDLIFFSMYTDQFYTETLDDLKTRHRTIAWFGDDTWRFETYTRTYAPHFSYCITTDKYTIHKYRAIGQDNVVYSQWAAIDQHPRPEFSGYDYDISFVGGYSDQRAWFLGELENRGLAVKTYGQGWPNGGLTDTEMGDLFVSSRINLNLPNSALYDIRYAFFRPKTFKRSIKEAALRILSPRHFVTTFKVPKFVGQIKGRNFEIPYFRGFQISDYFPSIEDYFILGEEIVCFRELDELEFLIRYYLKHHEEREQIRDKGHQRTIEEHGYSHRLRKVLEQLALQEA